MAITLTYNGTTAALSKDLRWEDEYDWSPVVKTLRYTSTGALFIRNNVKKSGRPITLLSSENSAWCSRALCDTLQAWSMLPDIELTLTLRGVARQVVFDHTRKAFEARPVVAYSDPDVSSADWHTPILRFIEV